ncbi:synaptotagmin-6-like isoform X2 [Mytilus galloprovincialis]|uniref:synaptotagmin-6-like isoform X2 n=1 Tax=Mytilus galloprovincialis TaxID=29158 RepID=UPI003F7C1297
MSRAERQPDYLIVAYIVVPTTILILLLLLLYVTCSKRFRLNWYERFLLEEKSSDKKFSEAKNIKLPPKASVTNVLSAIGVGKERRYSKVHFKTEWMPVSRKMGSSPSSPTRDVSEKFWVPPAVLERKRAQSLVPTVPHHDSDDGSSGNVTPGSVSGFRDSSSSFTFANDGLPPLPSQRQRRASMQDAIDLKKIDAKLYDRKQLCRQHSLTSNEEENLGAINCSLQYNKETHLLSVNIIQAEDLVACDVISGTSNPYCKVSLLPDHKSQLQTRVHKKTLAPKFDEEFIFDISPSKLPNCYLEILVFSYDQFSTHDCIGQVKIALLDSLNLTDKVVMWKGISPYQEEGNKSKDVGEIMFSLSYLSSAERLTVVVMKARNLKLAADESKLLDPYVKVSILCDGKRIKKKKTSTVHVTHEPVWNEALVFNIGKELLKRLSAEFQIFHDNTIGNDELVGRVKFGYDTVGDGKIHWNDLMTSNSAVPRWHELQE